MNLEQLEYVVEIAKTQSFSAASEHLHVTQSAISQSIHRLENELGMILFERSRHGTRANSSLPGHSIFCSELMN
ncbi:LysR family transcriptional regulator [Paenibacillus pabuli]|uniref:LysR family transcriptional regulator n=1 Tax=Paenibacillus pabuli TaxID=1472 RepID=UPI001FFE98D3|nr:LysR family transcriptional regulator [Paenibacillus pabuli]